MYRKAAFYLIAALVFWRAADRAMYENADGIFTGFDTNIGDLPFHIAITTGFAYGHNFPPQHPEFAGVPLTYPFVTDLVAALFVKAGASLRTVFFWQTFLTLLALFALLHYWSLTLTEDRTAGWLTPVLVFLGGGFGWVLMLKDAAYGEGVVGLIGKLPRDYTVGPPGFRWGNALTALFIPQRGMLLGVALVVLAFTLIWKYPHRGFAPGLIAGILPLIHAHSFAVLVSFVVYLLLEFGVRRVRPVVPWNFKGTTGLTRLTPNFFLSFFSTAAVLAVPQIVWLLHGSAVNSSSFLAWQPGWDHGSENPLWFWFKNTGLFIPLLVISLIWLVRGRLLYFYLPFTLCFFIPNLFRMSPWIWDNIKFLFFWWVASAPIVALLLSRLWRDRRGLALALLMILTAAGGLDVWRAISGTVERRTFDPPGIAFADMIRSNTSPQALIVHAPTYNDPVYLTGRRTFMGYDGHLWSHGLDYAPRAEELKRIYQGAPDAVDLLVHSHIDYIVVGPLEKAQFPVNEGFFERFPKVAQSGDYRLYRFSQIR